MSAQIEEMCERLLRYGIRVCDRSAAGIESAPLHTSVATTEDYMCGFEVKEANLQLTLPKPKKSA